MAKPDLKHRWPIILSCALLLLFTDALIAARPASACFLGFGCQSQSVGTARGRKRSNARRDSDLCQSVPVPLTAVLPNTGETFKTSSAYPTFWFYFPTLKPIEATSTPNQPEIKLKFVLQDEQEHDVYQTRFQFPEPLTAGVVGLRFLAPTAALETGKKYRWYFLAYCDDPEEIYEPSFVEGLIQREVLNADRQAQIDQATPPERVLAYAKAGLWYDTLAALDPIAPNGDMSWPKVLESVGVPAAIAQQPNIRHYYIPDNIPANQSAHKN